MVIDFHTHIFPDKIAGSTIRKLEKISQIKASTDGTETGLLHSMEEAGVDISVLLPVVTKPSQFDSILRFAYRFREAPLLSFGGVHPDSGNYLEELNTIHAHGIKGIKLHPDYQGYLFNDIAYKRILYRASELGLIITVHAGFDPLSPDLYHATPEMILEVLNDVKPEKLVLAHMGGTNCWDKVESLLVGQNVYLDTAVVLDLMPREQFIRMVRNHGAERILFATDSPWAGQKEYCTLLESMELSEEEKEQIFHINAEKLLTL